MRLLKATIIIFLFTSCGYDWVDKHKLPGRYVFTHWDRDTIDVRSDGTYRHYTFKSGRTFENTGTWKLNSTETEIDFENFSFQYKKRSAGVWISKLRGDGEEIHLMYAKELNAYYNKVSELDSLK